MTLQPLPIVFPDAELWATGRLRTGLADRDEPYATAALVSNAIPFNPATGKYERRDYMVIVRRDGGLAVGVFDLPRFGINVWGKTEQGATDLARLVVALLKTLPGDGVCVAIDAPTGPSRIADESGQPRRFISVQARLRGTPLEEF